MMSPNIDVAMSCELSTSRARASRSFIPLLLAGALSLPPQLVLGDQMELRVKYSCGKTQMNLEAFSADGGGPEAPFLESETDHSAVWNLDRLMRKLPIIKTCTIDGHEITAVITQHCASRPGIGISAAMYTDTKVTIKSQKEVIADHHPSSRPSALVIPARRTCLRRFFRKCSYALHSQEPET